MRVLKKFGNNRNAFRQQYILFALNLIVTVLCARLFCSIVLVRYDWGFADLLHSTEIYPFWRGFVVLAVALLCLSVNCILGLWCLYSSSLKFFSFYLSWIFVNIIILVIGQTLISSDTTNVNKSLLRQNLLNLIKPTKDDSQHYRTRISDNFHRLMDCCGADGADDYTTLFKSEVPDSCINSSVERKKPSETGSYFKDGCTTKFEKWLTSWSNSITMHFWIITFFMFLLIVITRNWMKRLQVMFNFESDHLTDVKYSNEEDDSDDSTEDDDSQDGTKDGMTSDGNKTVRKRRSVTQKLGKKESTRSPHRRNQSKKDDDTERGQSDRKVSGRDHESNRKSSRDEESGNESDEGQATDAYETEAEEEQVERTTKKYEQPRQTGSSRGKEAGSTSKREYVNHVDDQKASKYEKYKDYLKASRHGKYSDDAKASKYGKNNNYGSPMTNYTALKNKRMGGSSVTFGANDTRIYEKDDAYEDNKSDRKKRAGPVSNYMPRNDAESYTDGHRNNEYYDYYNGQNVKGNNGGSNQRVYGYGREGQEMPSRNYFGNSTQSDYDNRQQLDSNDVAVPSSKSKSTVPIPRPPSKPSQRKPRQQVDVVEEEEDEYNGHNGRMNRDSGRRSKAEVDYDVDSESDGSAMTRRHQREEGEKFDQGRSYNSQQRRAEPSERRKRQGDHREDNRYNSHRYDERERYYEKSGPANPHEVQQGEREHSAPIPSRNRHKPNEEVEKDGNNVPDEVLDALVDKLEERMRK